MVDFAAVVPEWVWPVDAGRDTQKGDSGRATDPFGGCREAKPVTKPAGRRQSAAGRDQAGAGVVESTIYLQAWDAQAAEAARATEAAGHVAHLGGGQLLR
jgi:hypothetical protein